MYLPPQAAGQPAPLGNHQYEDDQSRPPPKLKRRSFQSNFSNMNVAFFDRRHPLARPVSIFDGV